MGDRALPRVNKLVAARKADYEFKLHRHNVSAKRPAIDTKAPAQQKHLALQLKRKQLEAERMAKVERENSYLLEKMRKIMVEPQTITEAPFAKGSLNREARKREMIKVMNQNEALLKRIQNRPSTYCVKDWEKDNEKRERLLSNIGEFPHARGKTIRRKKPAGSRLVRSAGSNRPANSGPARAPARTCVFSKADMNINGTKSVVSVYEVAEPFRLEIVALDEANRSNRKPVAVKFTELRARFADQPELLSPEGTELLVLEVLKLLQFGPDPKNRGTLLQLQFKPERPTRPQVSSPSKKKTTRGSKKTKKVDLGVVMPLGVTVACRGLPAGTVQAIVSVKNKTAIKFKLVGKSEEIESSEPSFEKVFEVDSYEKLDRELKVEIMGEGQSFEKVMGSVTVDLSLFASLPNGEVELKLLDDNGTAVEGAMVTLKQAEVDLPPVSARKQAISRGGVTMVVNGEKEQFLYTATDTGSKYSFSFYLQKTTKTYDTEVAQEDFPDLSQQLGVEPPVLESKADKAAWVDMLLPLFTTVSGSKSKVSVVFNVPLTLSLACRDLQKAGAEGEVDAVVRAVVATDGGERELGTTEKISGNSPDFKQTITATMLSKGQTLVFSLFDSADKLTDDDVIGTAVVDGEGLYELNATKRLELKLNNREGVAVGKSSLILSL